jgi:acylphosphatase
MARGADGLKESFRMAPEVVRRRVVVYGRVQGVGFRYSVRERALVDEIDGWVRNRPDGAVEAVFQGELERVERVVRFCGQGPRGAQVKGVDVREELPEELFGFEIR